MHTFSIAISIEIEEVLVEEVVGITGTRFTQAREKQMSHDQLETSVMPMHSEGWGILLKSGSLCVAVQSLALLQNISLYVTIRKKGFWLVWLCC